MLVLLFVLFGRAILASQVVQWPVNNSERNRTGRAVRGDYEVPFVDGEASMRYVPTTIVQPICSPFYLRPRDFEIARDFETRRWRSFFERQATKKNGRRSFELKQLLWEVRERFAGGKL